MVRIHTKPRITYVNGYPGGWNQDASTIRVSAVAAQSHCLPDHRFDRSGTYDARCGYSGENHDAGSADTGEVAYDVVGKLLSGGNARHRTIREMGFTNHQSHPALGTFFVDHVLRQNSVCKRKYVVITLGQRSGQQE